MSERINDGLAGLGASQMQLELAQAKNLAAKVKRGEQTSNDGERKRIEEAATQFEALMLNQMIKSMWTSVSSEDSLFGSREEELYRDMLNQALADSIASSQSIGIKDIVVRELTERSGGGG